MSKINTVIFDFDGTLADTNDLIIKSWQAVYMARHGKEGDHDHILSTFGEPLYHTMGKTFPEFDIEESVDIYRSFQKDIFKDTIKPFPGMVELIKELKEKGYKTGIVTSRLRASTYEGLQCFGVEEYIDEIVTVEDCDKHKPDPEPALMCLERLGSTPEESVMIGDSQFDIGCANNAGMTSVMVSWSRAVDGQDAIYIPDYIIEEAEDLWDIIEC